MNELYSKKPAIGNNCIHNNITGHTSLPKSNGTVALKEPVLVNPFGRVKRVK